MSQVWNCAFCWFYCFEKFTSTRCLLARHNTMPMKYLLDRQLMCFYNILVSTNNCVLCKLILHSFCDKKVMDVFQCVKVGKFSNLTFINKNIVAKFMEYCEVQQL